MGLIAFGLRSSARVEWNGAKGEIGSKARQAWTDIGKMGILKRTTYYEQQREQKKTPTSDFTNTSLQLDEALLTKGHMKYKK